MAWERFPPYAGLQCSIVRKPWKSLWVWQSSTSSFVAFWSVHQLVFMCLVFLKLIRMSWFHIMICVCWSSRQATCPPPEPPHPHPPSPKRRKINLALTSNALPKSFIPAMITGTIGLYHLISLWAVRTWAEVSYRWSLFGWLSCTYSILSVENSTHILSNWASRFWYHFKARCLWSRKINVAVLIV